MKTLFFWPNEKKKIYIFTLLWWWWCTTMHSYYRHIGHWFTDLLLLHVVFTAWVIKNKLCVNAPVRLSQTKRLTAVLYVLTCSISHLSKKHQNWIKTVALWCIVTGQTTTMTILKKASHHLFTNEKELYVKLAAAGDHACQSVWQYLGLSVYLEGFLLQHLKWKSYGLSHKSIAGWRALPAEPRQLHTTNVD